MKKIELFTLSLLLLFAGQIFAQDNWTQKASFIGNRGASVSFTLDGKGYIATGYDDLANYYRDNWAYDPATNVWTQQADFPGVARYGATGFSINNIGYLATGVGPGGYFFNDMWAYDAPANIWTRKANIPGATRYFAVGFSINGAGYVGTGSASGNYFNDFWEYNVAYDSWSPRAALPTAGRHMAITFSIDNKAYVGTGILADDSRQKDLWQYDATIDSWTRKADLPGSERYAAAAFAVADRGYVASGFLSSGLQDVWEYYPTNDSWTERTSLTTSGRAQAVGFSIGSKGYFGTGSDGSQFNNDFYEYTPFNFDGSLTRMTDFPAGGRSGAFYFSIANKGYVGGGLNNAGTAKSDFWEFDPSTNVWTQKADYGGGLRIYGNGFSIGQFGYAGTGAAGSYQWRKDMWKYDPKLNSWTQVADFGGGFRYAMVAFSIGNYAYMGTGNYRVNSGVNATYYNDFWKYDPDSDTWERKADLPGQGRYCAFGFGIGNKGYIGSGIYYYNTYQNDFWEYNPQTDTWTRKADFAGQRRANAATFAIGNKGYVGAGVENSTYTNDLWSYSPTSNSWDKTNVLLQEGRNTPVGFNISEKGYIGFGGNATGTLGDLWEYTPPPEPCGAWTQLPDFPGLKRAAPVAFSIGDSAYITTGSGPLGLLNDTWRFDPVTKIWTQKADFPGIARHTAVGFVINNKAYVGTGINMYTVYDDFYEYDPVQNSWTPKAAYPAGSRYSAMAFSIGNKGYVGCGKDQSLFYGTADFFEYNPATDTWTQKANVGSVLRSYGVGFSVGNKGYIGLGVEGYDTRKKDIWQYTPGTDTWIQKADFPGTERYAPHSFTIGQSAFVGSGWNQVLLNDLWVYNATTDTWEAKNTPTEMARGAAAAFSIKDKGYVGFGMDNVDFLNTIWEYNSCIVPVKPTLSCVEDRITFSTIESCSQVVEGIDPIILPEGATAVVNYTISRNGEIVSSGTGSVSGLTFLQGVNSVTYSLPEYPGQVCSFIVYVVDTVSPVVVSPPAQTICYNASNNYAIPSLVATDNCTITSITYDITGATTRSGVGIDASGLFNPGMHVITWTVTDVGANTVVSSMIVRIDQMLQVNIPDVSVVLWGGRPNTIYKGYGLQCAILTANASGGTKLPGLNKYRYLWSNGATTQSIVVCPGTFGLNNYSVTVTDSLGCAITVSKTIQLVDVRCGPKNNEVLICWNRKTTSCYTPLQATFALMIGAQLGSCSPAPAQAIIVKGETVYPMEAMEKSITVIPNPNNGSFIIHLKNMTSTEIRIIDQNGRIVYRNQLSGMNKTQAIPVNITNLAKGINVVQAVGKDGVVSHKMVVQ